MRTYYIKAEVCSRLFGATGKRTLENMVDSAYFILAIPKHFQHVVLWGKYRLWYVMPMKKDSFKTKIKLRLIKNNSAIFI